MSDSSLHLQLNRDRFEISEAFLEKYNRPGPRYTSYPTAPVWQDNFGPDDLEQYYVGANAARTPVSLYMHLPFCESLCLFCACNVVITKDHSVAPPYIKILEREIEHVGKFVSRDRPIVQFHWGGGTPTYLTPEQMEQLFRYTAERFTFAPDAEIILADTTDEARRRVTSPSRARTPRGRTRRSSPPARRSCPTTTSSCCARRTSSRATTARAAPRGGRS